MKKKINNKEEIDDCDDCPICQVMKSGEANTVEGLMKAFQKAQEMGVGRVGFGDIGDKDGPIPSPYSKP